MPNKLEVEWHRLMSANRPAHAYHAYLQRARSYAGLKGLFEYATHPHRAKELLPALLRYASTGPVHYGGESSDWTLSKGLSFEMHFSLVAHPGLRQKALLTMATRLWARRIQVWGDPTSRARSAEWLFDLFARQMLGDSTSWEADPEQGPTSWIGIGAGETLWVCSDTGNRDFNFAVSAEIDTAWAEQVRLEVLTEFSVAVEEVVRSAVVSGAGDEDEPAISVDDVDHICADLKASFELIEPLDLHDGMCRAHVMSAADRSSFRVSSLRRGMHGVTDFCERPDGSIESISWRVFAIPERSRLIEEFWPLAEMEEVSRRMPTSLLDPRWLPYLYAWPRAAMDLAFEDSPSCLQGLKPAMRGDAGAESAVIISVDETSEFPGLAHPRSREWIEAYAARSWRKPIVRYHQGLPAGMVPTLTAELCRRLVGELADALQSLEVEGDIAVDLESGSWPQLHSVSAIPAWHDGSLVSREQAVFGDGGMGIANHVADWPESLAKSFDDSETVEGVPSKPLLRGPANMLRRGLGTWICRAISPAGQSLLYSVLTDRSPRAFSDNLSVGSVLDALDPVDSARVGQIIGCEKLRYLWGWEFSWAVAFALGGSRHAAVEVRAALQEKLYHTSISAEMPGWTLRGPSELTFVQFGSELIVGERKFSDRSVERRMIGAYIWSKERFRNSGEPVELGDEAAPGETTLDLSVALVGVDRFSGKPGDLGSGKGWSMSVFKSFSWRGLDSDLSLNEMLVELSSRLELESDEDSNRPSRHKSETYEADRAEDLRMDRLAFEMTMKEVSKILLYMQMRDARIDRDDRTYGDNVGRGEHPLLPPRSKDPRALRGGSAPSTVLRRLRIGPEQFDDDQNVGGGGGGAPGHKVSAHPRIGHIRHQACGPGLRDRKPIWIKPMWIGLKSGYSGPPRVYDVG